MVSRHDLPDFSRFASSFLAGVYDGDVGTYIEKNGTHLRLAWRFPKCIAVRRFPSGGILILIWHKVDSNSSMWWRSPANLDLSNRWI
jgi:hypothetical protein